MAGLAVAITTIPVHLAALLVVLVDLLAVVLALGRRSGVSLLMDAKVVPLALVRPEVAAAAVDLYPEAPEAALVTRLVVKEAMGGVPVEAVFVLV